MMSFRYRDKGTVIHKLSPFAKLGWAVALFVLALIFNHPVYFLLLFLSTLPFVAVSRVWREWAEAMKFALYLCLAVIIINALVSNYGSHILWQAVFRVPVLGTPTVTLEALLFGVGMSLRLLAIISALTVLTLATNPDDIMLAMIKMKLPYKSVLVTSLSTRFIPAIIDDAERIGDVQRSRGLELDGGNLIQRVRRHSGILIPLLSNSLDRTVQVAEAMESRAFGVLEKRAFFKELRLSKIDALAVACSFSALILGAIVRLWGMGDYRYYPSLEKVATGSFEGLMLFLLVMLLCLMIPVAVSKQRAELD